MKNFLLAFFASVSLLHAQSNVIIDGTSGTNSSSASYSTDGGLNLSLGFFADYLVVGGGGSGGTPGGTGGQNTWGTGGGGGGGMLTGNMQLSVSNYSVAVGSGGTAPSFSNGSTTRGANGSNSVFGSVTALGGGGGAGGENDGFGGVGASGGSGGGGGSKFSNAGGAGTTNQGYTGGNARNGDTSSADNRTAGGGGGGAGGVGGTPVNNSSVGGNGGAGLTSAITGVAVTYAGGGGGGARDTFGVQTAGSGGSGGGGAGSTQGDAGNGTNGLGGGGGGRGADGVGGNGGSGVVIARYQGASLGNIGGTVTAGTGTATGYTIHTFTNTGSANFNMSGVNMGQRLGATLSGNITGTGDLTYSGPGRLSLTGNNTYTGSTAVNAGELNVNGSIASSPVSVASGASLSGSGSVGAISGSGSINPGNSPGILTAPSVDASGGLSFNFEFTSLSPVYSNATASLNDVLRLTGEAPFVPSLTSSNAVNLYFNVPTFENGQVYTGGFFTDQQADFLMEIVDATFTAYVADINGTISYDGQTYRLLEGLSVSLSTTSQTAGFAGGSINGRVMQVQVVPEPSTYALLALAAAGLGAHFLRRRRR